MTAIEIVLILIGLIFMVGSFFVGEKLSESEIHEMSELSHVEINRILEKELEHVENKINEKIDDAVNDTVDNSIEKVQRELDKETNDKIMAIDDYSNTVIESMNKTHNEIMFLYSMLNDKHATITDATGDIQELLTKIEVEKENISKKVAEAQSFLTQETMNSKIKLEEKVEARIDIAEPENTMAVMDEAFQRIVMMEESEQEKENLGEKQNHNTEILELHKQGKTNVQIAKTLGLGMGEVKLVLDLFREEEK